MDFFSVLNRTVRGVLMAVAALSLAGCAGGPQGVWSDEARVGGPLVGEEAKRSEVMYSLLAAEIAGQKGEYPQALDAYLKAAHDTPDPRVAERATQIALYAKQTDKALEAAELWLARDPANPAANKIMAALLLKTGRIPEAMAHLDSVLQGPEADAESTLVDLARLISQELPIADSLRVMAQLAERYPRRAEVHYAHALLALEQDQPKLAQAAVEKALNLRPGWTRALALQAQVAARLGDNKLAQAILEKALRAEPGNIRMRLVLAEQLMRQGRVNEAESQFRTVLKKEPDHEDAAFGLAMALLQRRQEESAAKLLAKLAEGARWSSQASYYLGLMESKRKHYEAAVDWFEQVSSGNLVLEAQSNAVSLLIALKRNAEAVEKLRQLRKRFPEEALRFFLMEGELLTRNNDYAGAFDLLNEALQSLPGRQELLYTRALVAEHLDRLDVLEQDLNEILKQNPDDVNALNALGYTLADKTNRYSEAQRLLNHALELKPDDAAVLDSYGWLQYRLGNTETALDYLRRAYAKNPDPEIAVHLGEVLWTAGRRAEAKAIWRQAVKKDADNEHVKRMMEQFKEAFE